MLNESLIIATLCLIIAGHERGGWRIVYGLAAAIFGVIAAVEIIDPLI